MVFQILDFLQESVDHFVAKRIERPLALSAGGIIAEDTNQGRTEKLGNLHRKFKAIKMLLPRLVNRHFPNRRADADNAQPMRLQLRPDFISQVVVKVHDVFAIHASKLEMCNLIFLAYPDLFIQIRRNFVGKSGQLQHGTPREVDDE